MQYIFGIVIVVLLLLLIDMRKSISDNNRSNINYEKTISDLNKTVNEQNKTIVQQENLIKEQEIDIKKKDECIDIAHKTITEKKDSSKSTTESDEAEPSLDDEQYNALMDIENSNDNFFITGKAGTGKSYMLDVWKKHTSKKHIILAPTGISALNVGGVTLHSTFGFYNLVNLDIDMISSSTLRLKSEKAMVLKEVSTIVIDEISMVRADTFEKIDRILRVINKNDLPFGGKQLLVFGDLFQLPPIVKEKSEWEFLYDRFNGIYFFCSDAYKNGNFSFVELTINHRQKMTLHTSIC